jgi:RNA polymerase sigma-70 factor (ECF subfamily)
VIGPPICGHDNPVGHMSAVPLDALVGETEAAGPTLESAVDPLRRIVHDHFDFIWRLLRRLGVPHADVDDAVQQVFLVASGRLEAIAKGSERAFLYGTALRVASTARRTASRRQKGLAKLLWETPTPSVAPDEEFERREAIALLDGVLAALPDESRRVFVLSDIEGMSAPEIAVFENIPAGTVASRLRRARELFAVRIREIQVADTEDR